MKTQVAVATIQDLDEVLRLNDQLMKKEYRDYDKTLNLNWVYSEVGINYFRGRILNEDGCVFVAKIDSKTVGYICGGIRRKEAFRTVDKMAEIENMFVLEGYRGQGIGTRLVEAFKDWCKEQKVERIMVEAFYLNKRAIRFYKKQLFTERAVELEGDV